MSIYAMIIGFYLGQSTTRQELEKIGVNNYGYRLGFWTCASYDGGVVRVIKEEDVINAVGNELKQMRHQKSLAKK
ncbi:hypothetical protein [Desnuesiella massiliensis]|uniref:hypothetical protein n=1 Tax=Desnuesiella massiliensis TaxID=1650662 RepID=UPI0006E14CC7|nr:hypothetical protein [Desnuesiella massiliensis]